MNILNIPCAVWNINFVIYSHLDVVYYRDAARIYIHRRIYIVVHLIFSGNCVPAVMSRPHWFDEFLSTNLPARDYLIVEISAVLPRRWFPSLTPRRNISRNTGNKGKFLQLIRRSVQQTSEYSLIGNPHGYIDDCLIFSRNSIQSSSNLIGRKRNHLWARRMRIFSTFKYTKNVISYKDHIERANLASVARGNIPNRQ